jgi:hypothetical protein
MIKGLMKNPPSVPSIFLHIGFTIQSLAGTWRSVSFGLFNPEVILTALWTLFVGCFVLWEMIFAGELLSFAGNSLLCTKRPLIWSFRCVTIMFLICHA